MDGSGLAWTVGGYLAGTFPSTFLIARARRASALEDASGRRAGETDPHVLMKSHLGMGWSAVASTMDVVKALLFVLAARGWGNLSDGWLAVVGVAVVVGHAFPFFAREMAGRGLAAAAGVLLVLLPVEMAVAGVLIVLGFALGATGLFSTIGMGSVPLVAAARGQPPSLVWMGTAIFAVILLRRVEGVSDVVRTGIPPVRALWYRCVFDASGPPRRRSGADPETNP